MIDLERFPWDSKEQKESALGFLYWARSKGCTTQQAMEMLTLPVLFLFQKSHESAEWFCQVMGEQIDQVRSEPVFLVQEENRPR